GLTDGARPSPRPARARLPRHSCFVQHTGRALAHACQRASRIDVRRERPPRARRSRRGIASRGGELCARAHEAFAVTRTAVAAALRRAGARRASSLARRGGPGGAWRRVRRPPQRRIGSGGGAGGGGVGGGGGGSSLTMRSVHCAMWLDVFRSWKGKKKPG